MSCNQTIVVQKYGGASLGSLERIKAIARRIAAKHDEGCAVVVVASAIGGTTDELVRMANQMGQQPKQRELSMLLSTGEIVSASLLAMALQSLGKKAVSLTGAQCGITAKGEHDQAKIAHIDTRRILEHLRRSEIVVAAGYQGRMADDIAVLGRGGSDASAVGLAAALQAKTCYIYSDVDGVFTADPRRVPRASLLPSISYEEIIELAACGAQIMMGRAVEIGRKYNIDIVVGPSHKETAGTLITKQEKKLEDLTITGISAQENVGLIEIQNINKNCGDTAHILSLFSRRRINIRLLTTSTTGPERAHFSLVVAAPDLEMATQILDELQDSQRLEQVAVARHVAIVSIVGYGIAENYGVAYEVFETLRRNDIEVLLTSTSEIKISVVIDRRQTDQAVRLLHTTFCLDCDQSFAAAEPSSPLVAV